MRAVPLFLAVALLAGCEPSYSPNTYATNAIQQANKVEQGVIVGVREVAVSTSGTTGAVTGGAVGAVAGSQVPGGSVSTTLGTLGGTLVGGLIGSSVERANGETRAFEYVVRKPNNELISVTQRDTAPLALGQKVLVIAGNQARIVPDYTVAPEPGAASAAPPASPAPVPPPSPAPAPPPTPPAGPAP